MDQNMPIMAKKFWKIVRVVYFTLRKGISKAKLLVDLNMMIKRDKIAGKLSAIHNLMFHHHHSAAEDGGQLPYPIPPDEYEFSCSNTPTFHLPFHLNKRKRHAPPQHVDRDLFAAAMEVAASPALPGLGRTPMVRQLRITDSPFPLKDVAEDSHVDEAAEEFIMKFYKELREQNCMPSPS